VKTLFNARYELTAELGRGTITDAYAGRCLESGRDLLIKLLRRELSEEPHHIDLFLRAAERASSISHDAVAAIVDFGIDSHGTAFAAVERAKGVHLEALLFDRRLTPEKAVEITLGVLSGLEACHASGVLHRDIKPRNVVVATEQSATKPISVKLTDPGLTEALTEDESCLERIGWRGDSLRYMAPERLDGSALDERADIYSVGALLYEMLTGAPLIRETDELRALDAVRTGRWVRPVALAPHLPEGLLALVESALHLDPNMRPQTATDFVIQLKSFREAAMASAVPQSMLDAEPLSNASPYAPSYCPRQSSRKVPRPRPDSACPSDMLVDPTFPRAPQAPRLEALHADAFRGRMPSSEPPPMGAGAGAKLGWFVGAGLGFGLLLTFIEVLGG
jgi:eukaryotic-like serine/threonine-protein kinase